MLRMGNRHAVYQQAVYHNIYLYGVVMRADVIMQRRISLVVQPVIAKSTFRISLHCYTFQVMLKSTEQHLKKYIFQKMAFYRKNIFIDLHPNNSPKKTGLRILVWPTSCTVLRFNARAIKLRVTCIKREKHESCYAFKAKHGCHQTTKKTSNQKTCTWRRQM